MVKNQFLCPEMKFADIPGNKELVKHLIQSGKLGQVAHAQLFAAPTGGVGLMVALAFAQYLNCENPQEDDSCGTCHACQKTSRFVHPDLHFCFPFAKSKSLGDNDETNSFLPMFREFLTETPFGTLSDWAAFAQFENRTPIINIKTVRDMMVGLQLKAYEGRYKIQIIWLPETMRVEGSNRFLKLLEEPPPFTIFLLVSNEPELLLPTVISRTQRITIQSITDEELKNYLIEKFQVTEEIAQSVAALSEGSLAEARLLLEEKADDFHKLFLEWQRSCYSYDLMKILSHTDAFIDLGKELQKSFLRFSLGRIRHALALSIGADSTVHLSENETTDLKKLGSILSIPLLDTQLAELQKAYFQINQNAAGRIVFLDMSLAISEAFSIQKRTQSAQTA